MPHSIRKGSKLITFRPLSRSTHGDNGHVPGSHNVQPITILVVDDFALFRRSIREMLSHRPEFQIVGEASDGREAVQKAVELKPRVILLDARLPRMSGIEAARQIRQLVPECKILLMSYESDPNVVEETLGLGISGYLVKTSAGRELLSSVESLVEGRRFCSVNLAGHVRREVISRSERFHFEFDSENEIFLAKFHGPVTSESVGDFYRALGAAALLAPEFRSSIADFSEATLVRATPHAIRELAALPPADPVVARPRLVVAPNALMYALARMFRVIGRATRPNLHVVRSLSQAFTLLEVTAPCFEPIVSSVFEAESQSGEVAKHSFS